MQIETVSLGSVLKTYSIFFVGYLIVVNLLVFLAQYFFDFGESLSGLGAIPLLLAALSAGQAYGTKTGGKPPQGFAWTAALAFTVLSIAISAGLVVLLGAVLDLGVGFSLDGLLAEAGDDAGLIATFLGGLVLVIWVVLRFMFSMGAGQGAVRAAAQTK
jgi:hypothetical protein